MRCDRVELRLFLSWKSVAGNSVGRVRVKKIQAGSPGNGPFGRCDTAGLVKTVTERFLVRNSVTTKCNLWFVCNSSKFGAVAV